MEVSVDSKGSTEQLNFNANVKALSGQLDAKGVAKDLLGTPSYSGLTLGVKHPNLVKAIQIVAPDFAGQPGLNQAINFSTNADVNGKNYNLSNMKVSLGKTNFGGDLKINAGANPVSVRGNIAAGEIELDSLLGAKSSGGASSGGSSKSSGWSKDPIDLSFMNKVDVNVGLSAQNITYGTWNLSKPSTDLRIGGGQLNINGMKAGMFGGTANLTTQVKAAPLSLTLSNKMNGIDLEKLAKALSGSGKLKTAGRVDFDMNVNAAGSSPYALVNALGGTANLNGTGVTLKGFDLVKLARGLASDEKILTSAVSLVSGAFSGGQTKFDTVKGDYKITNGVVNITSMAMDNVESVIDSTGTVNLPTKRINVNNAISLKKVADLEPFNIKLEGSLSNPKTLGTNILQDVVAKRFQGKLADKIPDVLGDSATEKLKKFGIVGEEGGLDINNLAPDKLINNLLAPKKKEEPKAEPAPTPAPANDNVAPAPAPVEQKAEPAPVPVKEEPKPEPVKKIKKPEDALKTILDNQGSPEDAVNDLLKGLF